VKVLVLNAGSSSLKWAIVDPATGAASHEGNVRWQEADPGRHAAEVETMLETLPPVDAAGHRVVHGGSRFREAVRVTPEVREAIAALAELAPLHNPAALAGIDAIAARRPQLPQVAAFDTAFHATLPEAAATYALPREWTARYGLRRYGFHGLSVSWSSKRAPEIAGRALPRLVVCHLGAGCSATAVKDGRSVDTTMGFTPLEGLAMATRSGSVDPGLILHLLRQKHLGAEELETTLQERSGLLGVSDLTGDFKTLLEKIDQGDADCREAYDIFVHRAVREVGGLIAVLGGLDGLVFTGGIGEHAARLRADLAGRFAWAGVAIDAAKNAIAMSDADVSAAGSAAKTIVVTAREDLAVAGETARALGQ
jgi:acetate kinase